MSGRLSVARLAWPAVSKTDIVRDGACAYVATDAGIAWAAEGVAA